MKKHKAVFVSIAILVASPNFAMPVISIPQVVENVMTEIRNNFETLVTWKRELTQWKEDYAAITEFRLDGNSISKISELNTRLGEYGLDIGSLDLDNPKSEIGVYAKQLFDSFKLFDDCNYDFMTADQTRICEDTTKREVQEIATVAKFSDEVTLLIEKLNDLNTELGGGEKGKSSNGNEQLDLSSLNSMSQDYSANSQEAVDNLSEEEKAIYDTFGSDDFGRNGGKATNSLSDADKATIGDMQAQFDDAETDTDTDENTIKRAKDVTAAIKSITTTIKGMKIRYKLMKIKNKAKEAVDKRQKKQIYMKKFEHDNLVKHNTKSVL